MEIYKYDSYGHYLKSQIEGNLIKIETLVKKNTAYVHEKTIMSVVKRKPNAKNILCHGTRNAKEQLYFLQNIPNAYVIGSEVSTNASDFPHTIQHDFNQVKEEWIGQFDIVYSNSFDHSITPLETLEVWRDQLNEDGLLFLEHTLEKKNHISSLIDPLKIEKDELIDLIATAEMNLVEEFRSKKNFGYVLVCEKK